MLIKILSIAQIRAQQTILLTVGPWNTGESAKMLNLVSTNKTRLAQRTKNDPLVQCSFLYLAFNPRPSIAKININMARIFRVIMPFELKSPA